MERSGAVLTAWQDCRFQTGCAANDIVISRSPDGKTWSTPVRVTSGRNAVMPTIGVEPGSGRLAIAYYVIQRNGIDAELITSADGTRWSSPQRLNARRMPLEWMPQTTLGRMLADYIGVSAGAGARGRLATEHSIRRSTPSALRIGARRSAELGGNAAAM